MKRRRANLNHKYSPKADEILEKTGVENLSQLFSLFIKHFGDELIQRIEGNKEVSSE